MEECLEYFRRAIRDPRSVPPWSEWWTTNLTLIERVFPIVDYVRLKHRKLHGAIQILQIAGELPKDFRPLHPSLTGSCGQCGERIEPLPQRPEDGRVTCGNCGKVFTEVVPPDATVDPQAVSS